MYRSELPAARPENLAHRVVAVHHGIDMLHRTLQADHGRIPKPKPPVNRQLKPATKPAPAIAPQRHLRVPQRPDPRKAMCRDLADVRNTPAANHITNAIKSDPT